MRVFARTASVFAVAVVAGASTFASAAGDPLRERQFGLDRVEAERAWARGRGGGVDVAIIDTGVDLRHEDLGTALLPGRDFIDGDDTPTDENGHGTHVAGIVAATTGNGLGVAGVAPDAKLIPLRALDRHGRGVDADVARAIRFALDSSRARGHRLVINLALTDLEIAGTVSSARIESAVRDAWLAGAVIVAAAGNEDLPLTEFPAAGPNIISVGAVDSADRRVSFSNRRPLVVAPGEGVVSTFWDPATPSDHAVYAAGSGTSMAASFVSGIAALLLSSGTSNETAVERIITTAADLGPPGRDDEFGFGRVNAAAAAGLIAPSSGPLPAQRSLSGSTGERFEKITSGSPSPGPRAIAIRSEGRDDRLVVTSLAVLALVLASAGAVWQLATGRRG